MGQRGPVGRHTLAKRAGTAGIQRRTRYSVPAVLTAPEGLTDAAQAEWERITSTLQTRGALDVLDQGAIGDYIRCWERLQEAEKQISELGMLVPGARGGLVKNPAAGLARGYRAALVSWSDRLGLNYASRTRLAMPGAEAKPSNPFADFAADQDGIQ